MADLFWQMSFRAGRCFNKGQATLEASSIAGGCVIFAQQGCQIDPFAAAIKGIVAVAVNAASLAGQVVLDASHRGPHEGI